ncbi:MAG: hypothetical protein Q7V53_04075 [Caldisericota bacterium]|nr:hypothetical protein [Caldisericota bacterium]
MTDTTNGRFVETFRDISILRRGNGFVVSACDSLGGIGSLPADVVRASNEICGALTLRVCLNELAAVGAVPQLVMSLVSDAWEPTGREMLKGIRLELEEDGYPDVRVSGSTEENARTTMTGLGIAVTGWCDALRWRQTLPGDRLYLVGMPRVGTEVLEHVSQLLCPSVIRELLANEAVGDFIPCGSRGIRHEIGVLERETGTEARVQAPGCIDLDKSAGPATCGIVTVHGLLESCSLEVTAIGSVEVRS